jgi:hypothetical protein
VYLGAQFFSVVDFDPSQNIANLSSPRIGSNLRAGMAIVKYNNNGAFIWARMSGATFGGFGKNLAVKRDKVYVVGEYWGTKDFNPGVEIYNLTSVRYKDGLLCELDTDGNFVSSSGFGGLFSATARNVGVDNTGNIYLSGTFSGDIDLDPSASDYKLDSSFGDDLFFCKLDSNKSFV